MRVDAITLKQLRALLAVAEAGSLTVAAEWLRQTPPTIHSQIKNLEIAAGTPLLVRPPDGTGFRPTPAGEEMIAAARRIDANLTLAARQIGALSQGKTGHVVLGTMSTATYFVPRLVRMLHDRVPDVDITLKVTNRADAVAAMARGEYDLTVMGRPPRQAVGRAVPLGPHPHGIVLPPDHPMAGQDGFDPMRLLNETFLSREEGSGTRTLMEGFFDRLAEGQSPRTVVLPSNEAIKQAVLAGLGIAFLSLHTVHDEVEAGRLALLRGPGLPVMRHWYLVKGSDGAGPLTRAAERCAEAIVALGGTYLPQRVT